MKAERSIEPIYGHLYSWCPVVPGDVWEVAGHRVLCADFREADGYGYLAELLDGETCDTMHTTPPGTKGHVQQALRKAGLGIRTVNWADWVYRLVECAEVAVPTGVRQVRVKNPPLLALLEQAAARRLLYVDPIAGAEDWYTVQAHEGGVDHAKLKMPRTVFDPCLGNALDLRRLVREGVGVRGIEVIPRKCALALYNLWRWTGGGKRPERVA